MTEVHSFELFHAFPTSITVLGELDRFIGCGSRYWLLQPIKRRGTCYDGPEPRRSLPRRSRALSTQRLKPQRFPTRNLFISNSFLSSRIRHQRFKERTRLPSCHLWWVLEANQTSAPPSLISEQDDISKSLR